jgi:hypothetical protein
MTRGREQRGKCERKRRKDKRSEEIEVKTVK